MRVLIMAGGTGGHIFPALAVAKRLIAQGHTVRWLGSRYGMEGEVTTANDIPIYYIKILAMRGKSIFSLLTAPWRLSRALFQSLLVMWRYKPDLVLGMGGYVTGPAGLAAWLTRKKLIIHEQNAVAGMTNEILARLADKVMEGFPQSFSGKVSTNFTGNPVREDFCKVLPPQQRMSDAPNSRLKILVIGGSGGARALNNLLPQLLRIWPNNSPPLVWHQAGKKNAEDAQQAYRDEGFAVTVNDPHAEAIRLVDFIHDMPSAYTWADLIICRSGALTVAEIAAVGVASILIPYPYAVDDHQTKNARYLADSGAALIVQEKDINIPLLLNKLLEFSADKRQLHTMAQKAFELSKPNALDLVVDLIDQ